jgi:hypothetical protein
MTLNGPSISVSEMQRRMQGELSGAARAGYTVLLLVTLFGAIGSAELLYSEADLPARTQAAFGVLIVINLSWAALAGWVLTRRKVLLGRHRIMAARLAIVFSSVFVLGTLLLAMSDQIRFGYGAAALGSAMVLAAFVLHQRARRDVARLQARREALERALGTPNRLV